MSSILPAFTFASNKPVFRYVPWPWTGFSICVWLCLSEMGGLIVVDVYEDGKDIVAEMNVPGLKGEDIDVEVEDSYLRISGRREEVQEKKEKNHYAKEIRRGSFERVVQLPDAVEQEAVSAEYKDGVLKVVMPKREKTADKKVKVQVR